MATITKQIVVTLEEYSEMNENLEGKCLKCGNVQGGCEPDARKYPCENCGEKAVYGAEELLMMGMVG